MGEESGGRIAQDGRDRLRGEGRRKLAVFAALVLVGFLVWFAGSPGVTSWLFGVEPPRWQEASWPLDLLRTAIVYGSLALVAGFVFPRGFYLWGLALNLHGPVVEALTIYLGDQAGMGLVNGTRDIVGYVVLSALVFWFTVCCYTAASAAGAGLRVAGRRRPVAFRRSL